jgi:outer membrane protein assembly factor BamB
MPALLVRTLPLVLSVLPSLLLPTLVVADDWTAWRGPSGTGQSDAKGFPTTWSQTENIKWKVPLDGPGNSTPIIVGDKVFLTHSPAKSTTRGLHCFDRNTGELLWKQQVEYAEPEPTHSKLQCGHLGSTIGPLLVMPTNS